MFADLPVITWIRFTWVFISYNYYNIANFTSFLWMLCCLLVRLLFLRSLIFGLNTNLSGVDYKQYS